jgi:hypothetical protein
MKILFFLAALIFSATTSSVYSQPPTPTPTPSPVPAPSTTPVPAADPQSNVSSPYVRPDSKTRFKRYVNGMFGPVTLARSVGRAGIATWQNSPEEWGGQWEGFGKRLASSLGKNVIGRTTVYGLDEALKLDSHFYRSKKRDVGSKIRNALISPVTARNTRGKRVIGVPRIVGSYTSSIIAAEAWYPDRYDWKDGVRSGTISFGISAAYNLFKEFVWKK